MNKTKITDDQAELLAFLASKKTFITNDVLEFYPDSEIWDTTYKFKVYQQLEELELVKVYTIEYEPQQESKTVSVRSITMQVPDNARKILMNYQKDKQHSEEEKELQFKKLKLDLTNAERVYKSYWATRFIAWFTFAIALFLALLRLAEALKLWPFRK
ncbi:MAG TPA: hypothetical protein VGN63_03310 [Flavisolibacter sp.]|jgi:hypothetical protein|nr:hypothetical protein [Flavisolibacter sp.]